ncbi:hypothetical protein F1559_005109 [Cyanidiococcus yangmingshanensis]|uniref:Uncharacterized protein n=1 Tax=Cyanidiococcus yangmingshanensis TaxID=2690220 RepID=A0A7J7IQV5_9RHOD|nr:hypothetical protein F1559_005109 [Cyanidiococcus yangmingshanensis]
MPNTSVSEAGVRFPRQEAVLLTSEAGIHDPNPGSKDHSTRHPRLPLTLFTKATFAKSEWSIPEGASVSSECVRPWRGRCSPIDDSSPNLVRMVRMRVAIDPVVFTYISV